jgi:hypothetical protein
LSEAPRVPGASSPTSSDAGRKPVDGLTADIERIGTILDDAQRALADLRMARKRNEQPAAIGAIWRLTECLMADPRILAIQLRRRVSRDGGVKPEGAAS